MAQDEFDRKTLVQIRDRLVAAFARARAEAEEIAPLAPTTRICVELLAADDGARRLPARIVHSQDGWRLLAGFAIDFVEGDEAP